MGSSSHPCLNVFIIKKRLTNPKVTLAAMISGMAAMWQLAIHFLQDIGLLAWQGPSKRELFLSHKIDGTNGIFTPNLT